jgi:hypothetical protein
VSEQQDRRARLEQLRAAKKRKDGLVVVEGPPGQAPRDVPWSDLLGQVAATREHLAVLEREAVAVAREVGASWDTISVRMGGHPSGEQLRRRHGQT